MGPCCRYFLQGHSNFYFTSTPKRNRNSCCLVGLISPLQKGPYSERSLLRKNCWRLVHYLPPASVPSHPVQTKRPTAGKWIFLQRSSDKKDRGRKGQINEKEGMKTERHLEHPNPSQAQNPLNFFTPACLLSPPLPPCWPDKGSSLHQRPLRISHLFFYWKGQALAQSSAQAGKSSFLLFISQVRDDPRLNAMPNCPQYALQPLQHLPPTPSTFPSHLLGLHPERYEENR